MNTRRLRNASGALRRANGGRRIVALSAFAAAAMLANRFAIAGGGGWTNTTNSNNYWSTGSNWSSGNQPASTDNVNFSNAGTYGVNFSAAAAADNLNISAGAVTFNLGSQPLTVYSASVNGTSVLNLSGGTFNVSGSGQSLTVQGSLNVSNAASVIVAGPTYIAEGGSRTSTIQGTSSTLSTSQLFIGGNGNSGLYVQNGAQVTTSGDDQIGSDGINFGAGTLFVTSATLASSNPGANLYVGNGSGSLAGATVSGSGGITGFNNIYVATNNSYGSLTISGGASVSAANLYVSNSSTNGRGSTTDGYVTVSTLGTLQLSGVLNVTTNNSYTNYMVNLTGGTIDTGSLSLSNASNFNWTSGTLNISNSSPTVGTGGNLGSTLTLGNNQTLNITKSNALFSDNGTINVSGGSLSTPFLQLGPSGAGGTVYVTGGSVNVPLELTVGFSNGPGAFNQSGGSVATGILSIGSSNVSGAIYSLSGANSVLSIAHNGELYLGTNYSPGTLKVGSGTFNNGGYTIIGSGASGNNTGTLNQTGGNCNLSSGYGTSIGQDAGSNGIFNMSGGTATVTGGLTIGGNNYGPGGTGTLIVRGTANLTTDYLATYSNTSSIVFAGGTINTGLIGLYSPSQLNWSGGTLNLTSSSLTVGSGGPLGSTLTLNSGQALQITGSGQNLNVTGVLNLNGGSIVAQTLIGSGGTFNWSSGTITGTLTLNGGTLNATQALTSSINFVNQGGTVNYTGGFNVAAGSTTTFPAGAVVSASSVTVASGGTFNLSGGTINSAVVCNGTMNLGGGNELINGDMTISGAVNGYSGGTSPTNLSTGNMVIIGGGIVNLSNGTITGSVTSSGTINVTKPANGSTGPGSSAPGVDVIGGVILGHGGSIITQNGSNIWWQAGVSLYGNYSSDPSTNMFAGLNIASGATVTGTAGDQYIMTGGSALTNAGTFNDGGSLSCATVINSGPFTVGSGLTETGNFNNSGTVSISGTQNWSGGTIFINTAGSATFFSDTGASGASLAFNISGGTVNFNSAQHVTTIAINSGSLNIPGNATVTATSLTATGGVVNLTGGTVITGSLSITSPSQFSWSGGTLNISGSGTNLSSGLAVPSGGTFNLSGSVALQTVSNNGALLSSGTFNAAGITIDNGATTAITAGSFLIGSNSELIGYSGFGTLNQSGGTSTAAYVFMGTTAGSTGNYMLSGTGNLSAPYEFVGNYGAATFNQSAGNNSVTSVLYVGLYSGSSGTYLLSGTGTVSTLDEVIGQNGTGAFLQSGGTNTVTSELDVAVISGSVGSLNISAGVTNVTGNALLGGSSSGPGGSWNLAVTGAASLIVSGSLTAYDTTGGIVLNGGTLSVGSLSLASPSQLNWSGGTLDITAAGSNFSGTLAIPNGGVLKLDGSITGQLVAVNPGGVFNLDANTTTGILLRNMSGISLTTGSAPFGKVNVLAASNRSNRQLVLLTTGLTFAGTTNAWQGQLDLANNDMDIAGGSLANITNQVKEGYNGGAWNGTAGIMSTSAAADSKHLTALGVIQNNQSGSALYSTFDTFAVGASDILVKYTYYGDTNLNGMVDGSDYSRIDFAFVADRGANHFADTGWYNGDFNYDNTVNGSDYTLMDNAFNTQTAVLDAEIATPTAQLASAGTSAVPEPATLTLLGIGSLGVLSRRRIRKA